MKRSIAALRSSTDWNTPRIGNLLKLYSVVAKQANVGVFHRFAVMRHWREVANIPFKVFLSEDELHMNDWSYGCIAKLLAGAIVEAATRETITAKATEIETIFAVNYPLLAINSFHSAAKRLQAGDWLRAAVR